MEIYSKFLIYTIIQNIFVCNNVHSISTKPILFVIGYDGFRNDYLNRGITPTLSNFRANGVHSEYLKTVYPPLAAPAFHSIATGLYPENHGIQRRVYQMPNINDVTPIWLLNQMNGGQSLCVTWPGGDGSYNSKEGSQKTCTSFLKYHPRITLKNRADFIFRSLKLKPSINLVMFYVEQLDRITHFWGPMSRNSTLFIRRLDLLTKYIIKKLIEIGVYHRTNIFIVSDHGMISVSKQKILKTLPKFQYKTEQVILDDVNARIGFLINKFTPNLRLDPAQNYENLKQNMKGYIDAINKFAQQARTEKTFEIVRIPPGYNITFGILDLAACPGYILRLTSAHVNKFTNHYSKSLQNPKNIFNSVGVHGYLRQNDAMFMAKGPLLARFKKVEPFEMVDLYSAFTRILNIQGDYERDGNYSRILPIFPEHEPIQWAYILVTIFALAVFFTLVYYHAIQFLINTGGRNNT